MGLDVEVLWDQLIDYIDDGVVVPVVGPALLTVADPESRSSSLLPWICHARPQGETSYYSDLALRLAQKVGVPAADHPDLNTVAGRYLRNGGHVDDLYSALLRVSQRGPSPPTPKPLAQLANILAFRLFVTTTFDSLLDHALQEARPGTNIDVRSFSLRHQPNLEAPITASEVTIYHLFGTLGPVPDCYPLTQEDLIEFMFALRSE
ncbi:MAG: hypothetical protein ABSF64_13605, partial [Bryobacteraceae bacterium]